MSVATKSIRIRTMVNVPGGTTAGRLVELRAPNHLKHARGGDFVNLAANHKGGDASPGRAS